MILAIGIRATAAIVLLMPIAQAASEPASNDDEPGAQPGERPYELDWAKRTEPNHRQLVDFEDLSGWCVRGENGGEASLYRSREQFAFGKYSAKVVYTGTTRRSEFVIEPPEPITIPGKFTAVNLWVRGNNWGWIQPPARSRGQVRVLVRDAKDELYSIDLGSANFDYWFLMHRTVVSPSGDKRMYQRTDGKFDEAIDYPARLEGIQVTGFTNEKPAKMFFDALSIYEIQYPALTFDAQPKELPWPNTPDTILPTLKEPVRNTVQKVGDGYELAATSDNDTVRYRYAPNDGTLGDITVETGGHRFQPCWKGGIAFELDGKTIRPGDEGTTTKLVCAKAEGQRIVADWKILSGDATATYQYAIGIKGKSLIVDVTAAGGSATRFDIGLTKGLDHPKTFFIPYLTYGNDWPRIVCAPGGKTPVFLLALLDWYNSDASRLEGQPRVRGADGIRYNGGAVYERRTDGRRNDLRERLFINVSRDVHEILPNIPNPKCDTGHIAREYLWRNIGSPQREMLAKYKAYGIDKFIACHHEVGWRDAGESFTMRLRAAPRIGDDGLAEYSKWLRGLGYRFGTYTNYVDFAPVNSNWNEDDVCLNSDGTWQRAWARCYALKPLRAVEKEAWYAPRIHQKFGTDAQYCDVHTAYKPWGRTDYDARTPGAGMFRTQYNAFARLLYNESNAHHGPVFSEGNYHWFYAGIVDGNYATIVPQGRGWELDPIVDFDLLKMHPLMTDFGMGMPTMYYGQSGKWSKDHSKLSPYFDRFHVSTIAFGHIGFLASEWGFDGTLKSYYLIQALQKRYAMVPVRRIRYFDGSALIDTSRALATDAHERRQIHVEYENGLKVWCNLSVVDDWTVNVNGCKYVLPPASFVAHRPDDILAYSASVHEQRHELVHCADYLYLDSREAFVRTPAIATRGAVAVKPDGNAAWWIIPATRCREVTLSTNWLGCDQGWEFSATAHDQAGDRIADAELRRGIGEVTVMPVSEAIKYRLTARRSEGRRQAKWRIDLPRRELVKGIPIPATVEVKLGEGAAPSKWQLIAESSGPEQSRISLKTKTVSHAGPPQTIKGRFDLQLPEEQPLHSRCWCRFTLLGPEGKTVDQRWIDVTALPPFDLQMTATDAPHRWDRPLTIETAIRSHLPQPVQATVRLTTSPHWKATPKQRHVRLEPGKSQNLQWPLHLPDEPVVGAIAVEVAYGKHRSELKRFLRTRPKQSVVADFTATKLTTGQYIRAGEEEPVNSQTSGATVQVGRETVGDQAMPSIFMHPPYKTGVGYSFASAEVDLPRGQVKLQFSLGFQNGSSTTDGCLFKAVVIDGQQPHQIFARRYAILDKWKRHVVNLSAYAGKKITLKLITDVGPKDDSNSDWACWGHPIVVVDDAFVSAELHAEPPPPAFQPPDPLVPLTPADLSQIASAEITLETAGVNGVQYTSYVYFNGLKIGSTPTSGTDTAWSPGTISLPPEAVKTIAAKNNLVIKNPGRDCMKVRNIRLDVVLTDRRKLSSWVDLGPYCSDKGWKFKEGTGVQVGDDLPTMWLILPVK